MRRRRSNGPWLRLALLALLVLAAAVPAVAEEPEAVERGRSIYMEGEGRDEIVAVLPGNLEVPGGTLTCSGCHGRDGAGRPEGGVSPSNLGWHMLTRPYEVTSTSGRRHGPYDARALKRAIAMGLDPAGNTLQEAMPRFRMSQRDMADLVAYLRVLGGDGVPGVGADVLRIGTVVEEGSLAPASRAMAETLAAYFADLDAAGGIFGRRIELLRLRPEEVDEQSDVLALVGGVAETETLATRAEELRLPLVGPGGFPPRDPWGDARYTFYLEPGPTDTARALGRHAAELWPGISGWIVVDDDSRLADLAEEIARSLESMKQPEPRRLVLGPEEKTAGILDRLGAAEGPIFLLVSGARGAELAAGLERRILAPGSLAASWAGALHHGEVHLALPVIPEDRMEADVRAFRKLVERHGLGTDHLSSRLAAVVAARVLVAGLEDCGRGVDRERLVLGLESLRGFETGLTRPLSFGPQRRTGLDGLYVVTFAADASPRAVWYELEAGHPL